MAELDQDFDAFGARGGHRVYGAQRGFRRGRPVTEAVHQCEQRRLAVDIDGEAALFALVDGLGHGPPAAEAALRAVDTVTAAGGP
ncbi:hypothetical protein MAHJHV47_46630 [Mycobacterium avium subsp. hominissuis]